MLVATAYRLNGHEVVVAIIGGTMLALALTHPGLSWLRQATRGYRTRRLLAERATTGFFFVMGGYAAWAVWISLYKEVSPETDHLLRGASYFLLAYALIAHFEPFADGVNRYGWLVMLILYVPFALSAAALGAVIADFSLISAVPLELASITLTLSATTGLMWCVCAFESQLRSGLGRWRDSIPETILRRVRRTSGEETG